MATTGETKTTGSGDAPGPRKQPGWMRSAKRYGPIAAVVVLIAGAVVLFGGGGDDGDGDDAVSGTGTATEDELVLSGPMTPQKAELEGETDVDFGPNCDTETGRIKLISVYAPPCVEPFEGDNGGATSPGVTADEVKVIYYQADPALDPLAAATASNAGAQIDPESARETAQDFVDLYNELFEGYGRTIVVEALRPSVPLKNSSKIGSMGAAIGSTLTLRDGTKPPSALRRSRMYCSSGLSSAGR